MEHVGEEEAGALEAHDIALDPEFSALVNHVDPELGEPVGRVMGVLLSSEVVTRAQIKNLGGQFAGVGK